MANEYYETRSQLAVAVDGETYVGSYRVINRSVVVYYGEQLKFATYEMNSPITVAGWLLVDMVRRSVASTKGARSKKATQRGR